VPGAPAGKGCEVPNFPTRESLVEAAYRNELERLCEAAPQLLATLSPDEALRTWMSRYIDYATAKIGMADALRAVVNSGRNPFASSRERMLAAVSSLLAAGGSASAIRTDISAPDVLASLTGIALACGQPDQREQAERLMNLAMDGLRAVRA
jgi:AcrR family transcriptional regulator